MGLSPTGTSASIAARALASPTTCRFIPAHSGLPTIHELAEFADKGAFLGIGRTESLCLKRGNYFLENTFSKAFIKRRVTLQPSEEQGTSKHIDQQFWIGCRLQFS
jgi:hypothetical protein